MDNESDMMEKRNGKTVEERLSLLESRLRWQDIRQWVMLALMLVMAWALMSFKFREREIVTVYRDGRFGTHENDTGRRDRRMTPMESAGEIVGRADTLPMETLGDVAIAESERRRLRELIKSDSLVKATYLGDYRSLSREVVQARTTILERETARLDSMNARMERHIAMLGKDSDMRQVNLRLLAFSREFRPFARKVILGKEEMTGDWVQRHRDSVLPLLNSDNSGVRELARSCDGLFRLVSGISSK